MANMGMTDEIESALGALAPRLAPAGRSVSHLRRLSGGASQETWAFSVETDGGPAAKRILRRAPGGGGAARSDAAIPLAAEAWLIACAAAAGVPVPQVVYVCAPGDGLGEAFVMAFLPGETIARKILRDDALAPARKVLARDCGRALAAIHAMPVPEAGTLQISGGTGQIDRYDATYRSFGIPRPVFDLAFQVLRAGAPSPVSPVVVHGDFRLGNLMVDANGLAGVLDWELAHLGDPREDIGWLCVNSWRFGQPLNRAGGFASLEAVLEAYAAAGGRAFHPSEIDWWELLGSLKWGIMCLVMYEAFRSGADPSVERAAIGRRVSETEIDILRLVEARTAHA